MSCPFAVLQKVALCGGLGASGYGEHKSEQPPVFGDSIRSLFRISLEKGPLIYY